MTLALLAILLGLLMWVGPKVAEKDKQQRHLSSGKALLDDDDLLLLSVDQLITGYTAEELDELADIVISHLKDEPKRIREKWEDLLRRIYIASDEKSGIYH